MNREQFVKDWKRYFEYYQKRRLESGVPSVFEIYWGAHLSAEALLNGEQPDPSALGWLNAPDLKRHYSSELVYQRIIKDVQACRSCKLCDYRNKPVVGEGALHTDLMFVGEAPGADEDALGRVFVGSCGVEFFGKLLPKLLDRTRETVYIASTLCCRPPENRDPEPDEVTACRGLLDRQIWMVNPKLIIALGKHAIAWFNKDFVPAKHRLSDAIGKPLWFEHIPVLAAPHPAAYLRDQAKWGPVYQEVAGWAKWILAQGPESNFWRSDAANQPSG